MKAFKMIQITFASLLLAVMANPAVAAKGGNGGGSKGSGGGGGGSGFDTPVQVHLTITFRDESADDVQSDGGPYYDNDLHIADGDNVDAHIDASSGGNYGNLYLRTSNSENRTVWLDISDCVADCLNQPFAAQYFRYAGLKVAATESLSGGFCGMAPGQTITAPMQITYQLNASDSPGFIYFEPGVKGKSACRGANGSNEVTVFRASDTSWTVSGDAACVTWPGGTDPGGVVYMPFHFTADADSSCQ